jgi:DNA primase
MIDRATIAKINEAAQIYDVVSEFVNLKKSGAGWKGLCPFHDDRSPSFTVSPARNTCRCWACGEGGGPVTFLMKHEQISYPDALKWLAKRYGIPVVEKELTPEEKAQETERDSLFAINEWAINWFETQMHETADGRAVGLAYFRGRGFRDDVMRDYRVGFAPKSRDAMTRAALREGYQEDFLVKTGLTVKRDDGTLYDRYAGRVIFPIRSVSGKVVGFGGRVLDAATKGVNQKYVNSPESSVYSKKKELYGLFEAKKAIAKADLVYMVEGYTDVMAMHQMGVENVVASSGTALTHEQIRLVKRFTTNIAVLFDGDAAGIKASQRGIDMLLADGMNVKLLMLPDGQDPDEFARKNTQEDYQQYLATHQVDFIEYKTKLLLEEAQGDPIKLSRLAGNIIQSISVIPDDITRSLYLRQASQKLGIQEKLMSDGVVRQIRRNQEEEHKRHAISTTDQEYAPESAAESAGTPVDAKKKIEPLPQEKDIAALLVKYGGRICCEAEDENGQPVNLTVAEYISINLAQDNIVLEHPLYRQILEETLTGILEQPGFNAEPYFINHENQQIASLAFHLSQDTEQLSKIYGEQTGTPSEKELEDSTTHALASLKLAIVTRQLTSLTREMNTPGISPDKSRQLLLQFKTLQEIKKMLSKNCGQRVLG